MEITNRHQRLISCLRGITNAYLEIVPGQLKITDAYPETIPGREEITNGCLGIVPGRIGRRDRQIKMNNHLSIWIGTDDTRCQHGEHTQYYVLTTKYKLS